MDDKRLQIILEAIDETKQSFKSVSDNLTKLQESSKKVDALNNSTANLSNRLKQLAQAAGGLYVFSQVKTFLQGAVAEFTFAEQASAQLNAVLRSTKGVAGVTSDEAIKLAKSLQTVTTFGDDTILTAENMLLTFTNIKSNIFPQTTQMALDMSVALGQDVTSSAMQLGKALNDPVQGINALRRVGVNFTEDQRKMVEQLVKSGDVLTAQKMILAELNTEFGGSAQAQAQTYAGKLMQIKERFNDMKEELGGQVIPLLLKTFELFDKMLPSILSGMTVIINSMMSVINVIIKYWDWIKAVAAAWVGYKVAVVAASNVQMLITSFNTIQLMLGLTLGHITKTTVALGQMKIAANAAFGVIGAAAALAGSLIYSSYSKLRDLNASVISSADAATKKAQELADAYNKAHGTALKATEFGAQNVTTSRNLLGFKQVDVQTATVDMTKLREATKLLEEQQKKVTNLDFKLPPLAPSEKDAKSLKEAIKDLAEGYKSFNKDASDELFELDQNHKKTMTDISGEFDKVRENMAGLRSDYAKTAAAAASTLAADTAQNKVSFAEEVVKNEQRMAEIQKELSGSVGATKRLELQKELADRQAAVAANLDLINSLEAQITEARRVAGLSEFQRAVEEYNSKQAMAQADYNNKIALAQAELNEKLAIQKKELAALTVKTQQEQALYDQKRTFIEGVLQSIVASHAQMTSSNLMKSKSAIEKEIEMYKQLAEAIKAARSGDVATVNRAQMSVRSINDGVIGPSGNIITTSPSDFLIATKNPSQLASDVAAGRGASKGTTINFDFSGATFLGKEDVAREIGKLIVDDLKLNQRFA